MGHATLNILVGSSLLPGVVLSAPRTALSTWVISISGNGRKLDRIVNVFISMSHVLAVF
jgi:hypothetical protein